MASLKTHRCILFQKLQLTASFLAICLAGTANAGTSRLYPPKDDESGALRVAEVVSLATREEILELGSHLQHLLSSGLKDSDLTDGSLAVGRVNCCHDKTEEGTAMWFHVPPGVPVQVGDIVVVQMGRESSKKDPGAVNVAMEVRQKNDSPDLHCSWDPPDERLWMRVLYCDWMPAEGWTLKRGLYKTWLKRVPADGNP